MAYFIAVCFAGAVLCVATEVGGIIMRRHHWHQALDRIDRAEWLRVVSHLRMIDHPE